MMSPRAAAAGTIPRVRAPHTLLRRLAAGAPARVFLIEGRNAPAESARLRLSPLIQLVDSPRWASILLVAGDLPAPFAEALAHVHDQMPHPRRCVLWDAAAVAPGAQRVDGDADVVAAALHGWQGMLLAGTVETETSWLPDVDPAPWRGVGPFGQGGEGMMGGVPYGRPMAQTAPDRDGLELDQLDVPIGPFFPPLPIGLVLRLALQGDVVQEARVEANGFEALSAAPAAVERGGDPFRRALHAPVSLSELERARAVDHLQWSAHVLRAQGLAAYGLRVLELAESAARADSRELASHALGVSRLRRSLARSRALEPSLAGVACLGAEAVRGRGLGPIARGCGVAEDARLHDASYTALGFAAVTTQGGDALARWRQRLAEAEQSLVLAARAGDAHVAARSIQEGPRGPIAPAHTPLAAQLALLPGLLRGAEWGDVVTSVLSLDLDMRDVAAGHSAPVPHEAPGDA